MQAAGYSETSEAVHSCVISGFRGDVDEIALFCIYFGILDP
jgi:hypothetical protein